jgi:hypothetical protein
MHGIPICPEWWPRTRGKTRRPRWRPGRGPGRGNYRLGIGGLTATRTVHSRLYVLPGRAAADHVRSVMETTVAETARSLSRSHAAAVGAAAGNGNEPRLG